MIQNTFNVAIRRKIPFITNGVLILILLSSSLLFLGDLFLNPSMGSPDEMKALWFLYVVPDLVSNGMLLGLLGLFIGIPLFRSLRRYHQAQLKIDEDGIQIALKNSKQIVPLKMVRKIYWTEKNDRFYIQILQKDSKQIKLRLDETENVDRFSMALLNYTSDKNQYDEFGFDLPLNEE